MKMPCRCSFHQAVVARWGIRRSTSRPRARARTPRAPLDLAADSPLPRIAMISTHGYVAAVPPLGAADTGGQVVYVLELSKKLALLGYQVDIWTRRFERPFGDLFAIQGEISRSVAEHLPARIGEALNVPLSRSFHFSSPVRASQQ